MCANQGEEGSQVPWKTIDPHKVGALWEGVPKILKEAWDTLI